MINITFKTSCSQITAISLFLLGAAFSSLSYAEQSNIVDQAQAQHSPLRLLKDLDHDLNRRLVSKLTRESKANVSLIAFECGRVLINDLSVFNSLKAGEARQFNNTCFYIEHPKQGGLVWDAGLSDSLAALPPQSILGGLMEIRVVKTLAEQMEEADIRPDAVEKMAMSHLHFDHTGNMNYFKNADWLIQQEELDLAFSEDAAAAGFALADYESIGKDRIVALNGHHDVFGDGSVIILSTPGHTIGHQVLLVKLKETGPVVVGGDLYHFQENRENYIIPPANYDKRTTISSFGFIDKVLEATGAQLWLQHDADFYRELQLSPYRYR